ncbi:DUF1830 domain-containing protein [Myxacorys almedinensis]|uniref:DUF1830 domain-containing protein n=1 Tax=Myxacorys almedinensis A TaxID=2690445 RepID=A0A8J7ZAB5_9CYAN|nr:DUF1830 domain-containing protein [Myxacorys almedinensis]NDJ19273.1 DUF1830 domain-containing protein [Myxacorys almedinensis A]
MISSQPAPPSGVKPIFCYYTNSTNQLQIAKLANASGFTLERVVFPQQRILFEALPSALIKIYIYSKTDGVTLLDAILCEKLQVLSKGGCD